MLPLALIVLSVSGQIGQPRGVHLLDDAPLLAQVAPPLVPVSPQASEAQVSAQQLQVDLEALHRQRPGLGAPITLLAIGGGGAILGALYLAMSALVGGFGGFGGVNPLLVLGIAGLAIGLPLAAIGAWMLVNRLDDRKRIDERTRVIRQQLKEQQPAQPWAPPVGPPPPPLPAPQVRGPEASMLLAQF